MGYTIPTINWSNRDVYIMGPGEITVFYKPDGRNLESTTYQYTIYERDDCINIFDVHVKEHEVCGLSKNGVGLNEVRNCTI